MLIGITGLLLAAHLKPVLLNEPVITASDDYPAAALRREEEGITSYRLNVSDAGLPVKCEIERSSGFADLDERACAILVRRARFEPATDRHGNPVESSYAGRTVWKIHKIAAAPKSN